MRGFSESAIIVVGDELLEGRTRDRNLWKLSSILDTRGLPVAEARVVHDTRDSIIRAVRELSALNRLLVTSGGLGPTDDDLTLEAVASAAGVPFERNRTAVEMIRERYRHFGGIMSESALTQADIPGGAEPVMNPRGIAPGTILRTQSLAVISVPGVPAEAEALLRVCLERIGFLEESETAEMSLVRTWGIPENTLFDRLSAKAVSAGADLAFLPRYGRVDIKITGSGRDVLTSEIERTLESNIYSRKTGESLEIVLGKILEERKLVLAVAESCTGGMLGASLTSVGGSSAWFAGGVISYSNSVKSHVLAVPEDILAQYGAVSRETARAMAEGVMKITRCDVSAAVSGIAGPTGGTSGKPVGTVWIAVKSKTIGEERVFHILGDREGIRNGAVSRALGMLFCLVKTGQS